MRRIVNILAKMVSAIVLALIFLPLLVALLFEIPAVQNFVAREATEIISRKLGTRISIDRVDIGLFYRVSLDGFYVDDFQRDTLLYAGRLDARIKSLGLFGGGLVFSRAELSDARFCLRETPDGEMNIKQIVNRISDPDKPRKGNFRLSLRKASIRASRRWPASRPTLNCAAFIPSASRSRPSATCWMPRPGPPASSSATAPPCRSSS